MAAAYRTELLGLLRAAGRDPAPGGAVAVWNFLSPDRAAVHGPRVAAQVMEVCSGTVVTCRSRTAGRGVDRRVR